MSTTTPVSALIPRQPAFAAGAPAVGPGFRLSRLEVLNWGTFHRTIWAFDVDGHSALLTGGVGTGKSTLVDAMTTLLLPASKIAYNKAAGAEVKERNLRSYVLGYHRSERVEATNSTRPVGLRGSSSHSVILGVFTNYTLGIHITLAQVFWVPDANTGQPDRFYVTADEPMSIATHFTDFGTDINDLRQRLRRGKATIHTSYPPYAKALRRGLGIPSDQALDLFHQTVSMKAVGSLDEFVRERMLEPFNAKAEVDKIVAHFNALTASHDEVVRAKAMIAALGPIVEACDSCDGIQREIDTLQSRRDILPVFFAQHRERILRRRDKQLRTRIQELVEHQRRRKAEQQRLREMADTLQRRIDGAGGEKLLRLDVSIENLGRERDQRRQRAATYEGWLEKAGLKPVTDALSFHERSEQITEARTRDAQQDQRAREELDRLAVERHNNTEESGVIRREITSLQNQRSSIPSHLLDLRHSLAAAVGISADELPFAGELMQVRDDEAAWAGAAERVLRGFALSLLVPEAHYTQVSAWVNGRHLGLRLVYYKVPAHTPAVELPQDRDLLLGKLEIRDDSWGRDWLAAQLRSRADYLCAADMDAFTRSTRPAVTQQGLIKGGGGRHEKNDTSRIDDRRSWVLGWSNQAKLDALLAQATQLTEQSAAITKRTREIEKANKDRAGEVQALTLLASIGSYTEIDWQASVAELAQVEAQKKALVAEAGLDQLTADLKKTEDEFRQSSDAADKVLEELGGVRRDSEKMQSQLTATTAFLEQSDLTAVAEHDTALAAFLPATGQSEDDLDLLRVAEGQAATKLNRTIEHQTRALQSATSTATLKMAAFRTEFPQDATDLDHTLASAKNYRALHSRLVSDDLPRFETQFQNYLRTNVIRDVASFQARLHTQEQEIGESIDVINESLEEIDYNPGRYVRLNAAPTANVEIREFRRDLRECTTDTLATDTDGAYTEEKFLQVKRLLDRFKGRTGQSERDAEWTARVTDVRRWFTFSASEHLRSDGTEYEIHSDSSGKSGGQKEKLAYTVLAASLAHQFHIDTTAKKDKSFRFVVIDEAFGRGDDDAAHFGLGLFQRLGLQLLVVTPLQKLHVIEPHVNRVGYVYQPDKVHSRMATLTIDEFRDQQRAARQPLPRTEDQL